MSRISEKVAYLDGLMEGLNIQEDKYAKIFTAIVDALDLIAEEISDHEDTLADLDDSVEEIFENLDEYDDFLYGDEDEDEEDEFDEDDELQRADRAEHPGKGSGSIIRTKRQGEANRFSLFCLSHRMNKFTVYS